MKKIAYIGCLGLIGIISTEFGVIGILPQVAEHYQISIDKAGILLSAFALVIALTGPFMTLLSSGFDRKKIMMLSIAIFLLTGVVSSLAPPFWLLILVRLLPAFLQPVFISTAIAAALAHADQKKAHQLMGIVLGGIAIAMVTTVPFATYMASIFNWQASFVVQAVVTGLALLAIFKGMPPMPVREKKSYGTQLKILKNPAFLISATMNFLMVAAWFSTYSYFADYLGKVKGMDTKMISYMLFLFGITGVFSNWLAGKMLSISIPGTTAFFLAGTVLVPFMLEYSGGNGWSTIMVIAIWGFLYAPTFLNASAYLISAAPHALEFANSLSTSFGNLGVSVGTMLSGWVIADMGVKQSPWVGMCFGLMALLMIFWRTLLERNSKFFSHISDQ
ncbi:Predicted arabinose efflux permease, MFS family [Pedobacter steynii]|uniref:Predicted arabinose efflux permease, MFS family n=1 Tax=Pedobacter steynii TaxID=430522 RepID=A0A1H0B532_9SPHI|nr:MFS transporter [Pedobacter steynii]NQX41157.1 MFS transporter [Pedobacter steynii]SDN40731.1 Predicted arabinose efflux permease, MFS family [Pedobacter steynii]